MNEKICFYSPVHPDVKTYFEMIDLSAQYGLNAIEGLSGFDLNQPDKEHAKRIREYADSKNIKFCCFSVFVNLVGKDSAEMMERLKSYAEVAEILGSPFLHHTIANDYRAPDNVVPYKEEFFKKGVSAAREIYDYCEQKGMRTLVEEQGYLFNGINGIEKLLDAVNRNVGLVADFGNIYQAEQTAKDYVKAFLDRFAHAHIKDVVLTKDNPNGTGFKTINGNYMSSVEINTGDVGVEKIINMLKASGYSGYYSIEHTVNKERVGEMVEQMKKFVR